MTLHPKNVPLAERLNASRENGNIMYIATGEGWLFLAVVIVLFSRQVVGWSLREDMTRDIVIDALRVAWFKRHPSKQAGLIFRSSRGSQYASQDFKVVLTEYDTRHIRQAPAATTRLPDRAVCVRARSPARAPPVARVRRAGGPA